MPEVNEQAKVAAVSTTVLTEQLEFAKKHRELHERCPFCGRQKWMHQHPNLYATCGRLEQRNA